MSNNFYNKEINELLEEWITGTYTVSEGGIIDVSGDVWTDGSFDELPVTFGTVSGDFNCSANDLQSLKGCPKTVGGSFNCTENDLSTLEGGPQTVKGNYICSDSGLQELTGHPIKVGEGFWCNCNNLNDIDGYEKINAKGYDFDEDWHDENPQITRAD